jgi:hypothetical protein
MKYVRWLAAWVLFWIGHAVSRLDRWDIGWLVGLWYPVYNRCMCWSSSIQGESSFGPWESQNIG